MNKATIAAMAFMCASLLAVPGWAQSGPEAESNIEESSEPSEFDEGEAQKAARLFKEGDSAYQAGDYTKALSLFLRAHGNFPDAAILYNAARAAQRLGRWEQARSLALRAGEQKVLPLNDGLSRANNRLLEEVEAEIEKEERQEQEAASRSLDWRGWTGIGATALGAAGIVVGLAVYGQQAEEHFRAAEVAEFRSDYDTSVAQMKSAQSTGWVFVGSGIALAVTGLALLAWDFLDVPEETAPVVSAGLNHDGAGVSLRWSW